MNVQTEIELTRSAIEGTTALKSFEAGRSFLKEVSPILVFSEMGSSYRRSQNAIQRKIDRLRVETPTVNLYVHFPFCRRSCSFCMFQTRALTDESFDLFFESLKRQLKKTETARPKVRLLSVGGGTPNFLIPHLEKVLDLLSEKFDLSEMSANIELSPERDDFPLRAEKAFSILKSLGFRRVSFGIQLFSEKISRYRKREDSFFSYSVVEQALSHFEVVNVDVLFGLPETDIYDVEQTLLTFLSLDREKVMAIVAFYQDPRIGRFSRSPFVAYYEADRLRKEHPNWLFVPLDPGYSMFVFPSEKTYEKFFSPELCIEQLYLLPFVGAEPTVSFGIGARTFYDERTITFDGSSFSFLEEKDETAKAFLRTMKSVQYGLFFQKEPSLTEGQKEVLDWAKNLGLISERGRFFVLSNFFSQFFKEAFVHWLFWDMKPTVERASFMEKGGLGQFFFDLDLNDPFLSLQRAFKSRLDE